MRIRESVSEAAAVAAVLSLAALGACSSDHDARALPKVMELPSDQKPAGHEDWSSAQPWVAGAVEPAHHQTYEVVLPWKSGPLLTVASVWDRRDRSKLWDAGERPHDSGEPTARIRGLEQVSDVGSRGTIHVLVTDGCSGGIHSTLVQREDTGTLRVLEVHRAGGWAADCSGPYSGLDAVWLDEALTWGAVYEEPAGPGDTWLLTDSVGNPLLELLDE